MGSTSQSTGAFTMLFLALISMASAYTILSEGYNASSCSGTILEIAIATPGPGPCPLPGPVCQPNPAQPHSFIKVSCLADPGSYTFPAGFAVEQVYSNGDCSGNA